MPEEAERETERERERTTNPVRACVQRGSDRGSFWLCGRREGERERCPGERDLEIAGMRSMKSMASHVSALLGFEWESLGFK